MSTYPLIYVNVKAYKYQRYFGETRDKSSIFTASNNNKKTNNMITLKSNPIYTAMFAAIEPINTNDLVKSVLELNQMDASSEKSITMACICEVLEIREGEEFLNNLLDSIY